MILNAISRYFRERVWFKYLIIFLSFIIILFCLAFMLIVFFGLTLHDFGPS